MSTKPDWGAGDDGSTRSLGGHAVRKSDPLMEAMGAVDELNSNVGWCLSAVGHHETVQRALEPAQGALFALGATLAGSGGAETRAVGLEPGALTSLQATTDDIWRQLPELTHFIMPGGAELASRLHVTRAVCRRAERRVVAAVDAGSNVSPIALQYLNRLGDLLFALARLANRAAGAAERRWEM